MKSSIQAVTQHRGSAVSLINALTDQAFGRDVQGRPVCRPLFWNDAPRLLPSAAEEAALRRAVKNFYRYIVFVVFPVIIVLAIGLPMFTDAVPDGIATGGMPYLVSAVVGGILALPAILWIKWLGRDYPSIDANEVVADPIPAGNRPSLNGAFLLMALTLAVGAVALIVICLIAGELFS